MGIAVALGLGDFCCFPYMKVAAIVRTIMSKKIPITLIAKEFSLRDRYNSSKLCEFSVKASDTEQLGLEIAPLD